MPVFWLSEDVLAFPDPEMADPEGLLAVGGDLSVKRLLLAYRGGIFPWYNPEEPILWWSPDPRLVVFPSELKVSKSMNSYFNQQKFRVTIDTQFEAVIRACGEQPRNGQDGGTWISEEIISAYLQLFEKGFAHSVEVWDGDDLVGGLYGVALGKCFFGESMFARVSNASKFGFISLVRLLDDRGFWLVDCQVYTEHLASMGAANLPRKVFLDFMKKNENEIGFHGSWSSWIEC